MLKRYGGVWLLVILLGCLCMMRTAEVHAAAVLYVGNPNSMIYHNSGCRYFGCKACVVPLSSPKEALSKGFRACKICKG